MELPPFKAYSLGMLDLPFATWQWDCKRNIVTGDSLWDSYMGKLAEEAEAIGWMAFLEESKVKDFYDRIQKWLRNSPKVHFHLIIKETEVRPVEYVCHGLVVERDPAGEPLKLMGVCRHMFDHEAIPGLEVDLGHQAFEERRKLEALLIKTQRFEGIGKLAGGIAHDLNNLLAPIRMACEILVRKNKNDDLGRYLDIIQSSTDRARGVIQQILSFSRGSGNENVEILDPVVVLKDLENIVKETFPKRLTIEFAYNDDLPKVLIDSNELHQALLNLMINARDAIKDAGVISVRASRQYFSLRMKVGDKVFNPGAYFSVEVVDSGVGVPKEIQSRIFDPFFTTKGKGHGTGLGLASAFGIIANAGGFIDLTSELGKGSNFTIFLPEAKDEEEGGNLVDENMINQSVAGMKLLLVDDEENILFTMKPLLEDWGFEVAAFSDPNKAVEYARDCSGRFDFAIVDLRMPQMSGKDVIKALHDIGDHFYTILMTGELEGLSPAQVLELNLNACVQKPFVQGELRRVILSCLNSGKRE